MRRYIAVICGTVLVLGLIVLSAKGQATSQAAGKTLTFTVIDAATKKAVPGVTLKTSGYQGRQTIKGEYKTDDAGVAKLNVPEGEVRYFSVAVRAGDTFVPMRASWPERGNNVQKTTLPDAFTFPVESGTKIGGSVVDDAQAPISGATVKFTVKKTFPDPHVSLDLYDASAKSDAQGKWTYPRVPAEFDAIEICAWHHQYAGSDRGYWHTQPFADVAKLRDSSAQLTLPRGVKVEGVVFGSDGKPLKGASVGVGADRFPSNVLPAQKTDDNGKFSLGWNPGDLLVLTVKAKDHAPDLQQMTVAEGMKPVEFHLQPPKTLKLKIVDAAGKPISGVGVSVDTWRGCRTLDTRFNTDKEGRIEWKQAPTDQAMFDIYSMGYADKRNTPLTAGDEEVVITMTKPLKVTGTVVDAESGEPIKQFTIIPGITFDDKRISWERRNEIIKGSDGKFEHEHSYPYPGYALRIEAQGYLPADSRIYRMDEQNVKLEFKLKKGTGITGLVKGPDGKPVSGAKVIIATPDQTAYLRNGTEINDQGNTQAETGADGKYALPPLTGVYTIVVTDKSGYAELPKSDAEKSGDVTLTAWARIEGNVLVAGKPSPDSDISVYSRDERHEENEPRIWHQVDTKTDAAGHFVIERVRPGRLGVNRTIRIPMSAQSWMSASTHSARVEAKAGETVQVQLGGTGRPVVGRVAIPAELQAQKDCRFTQAQLMTQRPKMDLPAKVKEMTKEQRTEWMKSDEFKAIQEAQKQANESFMTYAAVMKPDGAFRADDIPAGTYDIMINASKPDPNGSCGPGDTLATASSSITIPPIPGGRSDEALEAGTLEMKVNKTLKVGDMAPAFTVKTLDGKEIKLSDYKGKYVLLDFWATWCGPCVAETPHLKAVYETFGSDPRFAMISLSLDEKTDEPKKFAEKEGIKWTQAFLGEWSKATLPNDYGVRGIPSIWLIGPDGKVLAKDLRGGVMKTKINQLMPK